jgi:hypothetical protein
MQGKSMSEFKENLEKLFNMQKEQEKQALTNVLKKEDSLSDAHEYTQIKLKKLMELGESVAVDAADVARTTGEPKAVDAFSNVLGNLAEIAKSVLKAQGEKTKIDKMQREMDGTLQNNPSTVNNTIIYQGTMTDILKKVKEVESTIIDVEVERLN